MDAVRFDRLTRLLGASASRRGALAGLLASLVAPLAGPVDTLADRNRGARKRKGQKGKKKHQKGKKKDRGKGGGPRKTQNQNQNQNQEQAQAEAARCCSRGNCTPGAGKNLGRCCYEGANLAGRNFRGANLGEANFTGATLTNANLTGANLGKACLVEADLTDARFAGTNQGAIFCRTTMPDGSINNSGCDRGTRCCETCNVPAGGQCGAAGDVCCDGAECFGGECLFACGTGFCRPGSDAADCCDGECTNLETDPNYCGACGEACADGEDCVDGRCGEICGSGFCRAGSNNPDCCDETCTNVENDPNNCGGCGEACDQGFACCEGGCANTDRDENNCGACGRECDEDERCVDGTCVLCDVCLGGCDFERVDDAIAAAAPDATIRVCPGLYQTHAIVEVNLTLIGSGLGETGTILDGDGEGPVLVIGNEVTATVENLTIFNGLSDVGGGIFNAGRLTLSGVDVRLNQAFEDGGGIYNDEGATLTLKSGSSVFDNDADDDGGGIYNNDFATLTLEAGTTVVNNEADEDGGGIYNDDFATLILESGSSVSNNEATFDGGGIFNDDDGMVTVRAGATVTGNVALAGGGIFNDGGTVTVEDDDDVRGNMPDECVNVPNCGN